MSTSTEPARQIGLAVYFGLILLAGACGSDGSQAEQPVSMEWKTSTPEAQGVDSEQLAAILHTIRTEQLQVHGLYIVRNGVAILDAVFYPFVLGDGVHDVASVTKSITATLVGIAIDKGYIRGVDQRVLEFFPTQTIENRDANKERMTVEDLLTMRSGLACGHHDEKELLEMLSQSDKGWVQYALDMPMEGEPGLAYAYCSPNTHLLSAIITAATGMSQLEFARRYLFAPLGIRDVRWPADPQGITRGWGDSFWRPQDMAKIGQLYLNQGTWNGKRVVSSGWIERSWKQYTRTESNEGYGYSWRSPDAFPGVFTAEGRGGQYIIDVPGARAVVAVNGGRSGDFDAIAAPLAMAFASDRPLAENPGAVAALQSEIDELAAAPPPKAPPAFPPLARELTGKRYRIAADNALGLTCVQFAFDETSELTLQACFADGTTGAEREGQIAVGLDNVYRVFPDFQYETPGGAKGHWASDDTFVLYLTAVESYYSLEITFTFAGDEVRIQVREQSGLFDQTFTGVSAGPRATTIEQSLSGR